MNGSINKPPHQREVGVTMVETLVAVAILGVLAALAGPAMSDLILNQRLQSVAAHYHSHIQWARSQAVQAGQRVHLKVADTADGSCYIIYTGDHADCSCEEVGAPCKNAAQHLLSTHLPRKEGVSVATSAATARTFDPLRGTLSPSMTVTFQATNGNSIQQITNLMGRTRSCSPNNLGGLKHC